MMVVDAAETKIQNEECRYCFENCLYIFFVLLRE